MDKKAKLSRLVLTNIRGFKDLDISFVGDKGVKNWNLLLGDNGAGKTTILKALALALGDRSHVAGLLQDFAGNLVRQSARTRKGSIRVEFTPFTSRGRTPSIELEIRKKGNREEIISYKTSPVTFDFNKIFVCGYGAGRGIEGTESWSKYRASDAVYSLFEYTQPLQNGELSLLRIPEKRRAQILRVFDDVMMLEKGSIYLDRSGIVVRGPWGELPLRALGDGYKSIFACVADLIGWALLLERDLPSPRRMNGIVLIDEIDQHLHPIWQRSIVSRLCEHFPNIQFIVSTHSPIVALGTSDLGDDVGEVYSVYFDGEKRAKVSDLGAPRGQGIDQILTSSLFGLNSVSDDDTAAKIRLLSSMGRRRKTKKLIDSRKQLISEINESIGNAPSEMEEIIRKTLGRVLKETAMEAYNDNREAIELELKRQVVMLTNKRKG